MAVAVIAVLLLFITAAPAAAADYSFTALPEAPGATQTFPYGINDASQTAPTRIVGQFSSGGTIHGFRFSDGVFIAIDVPGARLSAAKGINKAGQIVGIFGLFGQGGQHGFLRDINGSFTTIDVPGTTFTEPHGINSDGHVAGWFADAVGRGRGFLFAGGGFTTINVPGALDTFFYGINDSGQMVGNVNVFDGTRLFIHGLLLSGGTFTTFDVPGALETYATGITNAGQIVGWFKDATNKNRGFVRDTSGNFKTFDYPGSIGTFVHGTNDAGQIVGMFYDAQGPHGFLATPTGDCTSQVTVNAFEAATAIAGLNSIIVDNTLYLFTQDGGKGALRRAIRTGAATVASSEPGITFTADVSIADGPLPVPAVHIGYIQNVTDRRGAAFYFPKPDRVATLADGAAFPLLDRPSEPPPALYPLLIDTDPTGPARIVEAGDSPRLQIPLTNSQAGQLQSVDVTASLTMFLGCYDDQDPTFRTLAALDWSVAYRGSMHPRPLTFVQGADAGITAQSARADTTSPVQVGPIANAVAIFVEVGP
jgi:uncharacterized membrane protein